MRNALSVAIRTARAVENRNRYYFDHKRGAERGAFIQVKRGWMGDDWQVRRYERFVGSHRSSSRVDRITYFEITNDGEDAWLFLDLQEKRPRPYYFGGISEFGYESVGLYGVSENNRIDERWPESEAGGLPFDYVRRVVECKIDEYGWHLGEVEVRPDCEGIEE